MDTLLKRGVDPTKITSEGMLQSILKGIEKDKAMIARSKAEAQKGLATVMDMKGRKIKPGARIMGGEEVIETEAEIAERLGKGNKEGIERIKQKKIIEDFDPDEMASGGRVPLNEGLLVPGSKPSAEEIKEIKWKKKLGLLKKLKGGVGRRGWLNMVSEHLNDGLQEEIITKEQFNRAIMPLFGEAGETQTRALEKDDTLSIDERMDIYGKDREDYPAYLLAGGGRAEFAHGTRKKLTKEQLKEMLNVKKPKHYKESPLAIPDDWLKRLKEKFSKADGGRVPLFAGGPARKLWQKFIEKQFLKASNDIRQGKGLFKGLTQDQWIKQHDNLTKKLKEWEMSGKKALPPGMKEYFGMNEIQLANAFKKAEAGSKELDILQKFVPEGKPHASGGRVSLSSGGLAGMLGE